MKAKVITKVLKSPCYVCSGTGKIAPGAFLHCKECYKYNTCRKGRKCDVCGGTGQYKEKYRTIIANGMAIDSDNIG